MARCGHAAARRCIVADRVPGGTHALTSEHTTESVGRDCPRTVHLPQTRHDGPPTSLSPPTQLGRWQNQTDHPRYERGHAQRYRDRRSYPGVRLALCHDDGARCQTRGGGQREPAPPSAVLATGDVSKAAKAGNERTDRAEACEANRADGDIVGARPARPRQSNGREANDEDYRGSRNPVGRVHLLHARAVPGDANSHTRPDRSPKVIILAASSQPMSRHPLSYWSLPQAAPMCQHCGAPGQGVGSSDFVGERVRRYPDQVHSR
jgi:hypothetical protein